MLVGADFYYELLKPGLHRLGKGLPTLVNTHLGWIISGIIPANCCNNNVGSYHTASVSNHNNLLSSNVFLSQVSGPVSNKSSLSTRSSTNEFLSSSLSNKSVSHEFLLKENNHILSPKSSFLKNESLSNIVISPKDDSSVSNVSKYECSLNLSSPNELISLETNQLLSMQSLSQMIDQVGSNYQPATYQTSTSAKTDQISNPSHNEHNLETDINCCKEHSIEHILEKFWVQEEIQPPLKWSEEDELAENIFQSTTINLANGKFQVDLPFKAQNIHKKLGDSFQIAKHRFLTLEKKFSRNPELFAEYKKFIDEYLQLNHARIIPLQLKNEFNEQKYFVPHLCVLRDQSITTKLRVVFDFSCKTTSHLSLNDILLTGPRVQPELLEILCRFRFFNYVFTADIQKMYRQIEMNPKHNFLQNILWRNSPEEPLTCIELTSVSFGQKSAPYVACRVLNEIAHKNPHLSLAANALLHQTYVDDILSGTNSLNDLNKLHEELNTCLNEHGFSLHKFFSNVRMQNSNQLSDLKDLNLENSPCKILGLKWNPNSDRFQISVPSSLPTQHVTKRIILSAISSCFDPLGLVNPLLAHGKLIMQQIWLQRLNWDENITDPKLLKDWTEFCNNLSILKNLTIPRRLMLIKKLSHVELHAFCDASSVAYGCNVYLRSVYFDNSIHCTLLLSKSRVAPINKILTIPKLELAAMTLLSLVIKKVLIIFENSLKFKSVNLWSDSHIALSWVKGHPSRWSVYVSNRVSQIQEITKDFHWRHVRSGQNPADLLSRGQFPLEKHKFWFNGPTFLNEPQEKFDDLDTFRLVPTPPEEKKTIMHTVTEPPDFWATLFETFNSFSKLVRSIAYMLRFINNLKNKTQKLTGLLSNNELDNALKFIIIKIQKVYLSEELRILEKQKTSLSKQILSLNPFIDSNKILRVGGRLRHSNINYNHKHPILLPKKCKFTSLLLKAEHIRLGHSGPQNVLSNVRLKYWPLDCLREIKRIISKCVICHRFSSQQTFQLMSDLPSDRISIARPFQKVGVDFGGPFLIKSSRLRKAPIAKCYLSLFVCMVTKAVHLELVSDLTTEAFTAALKRFIARRGSPTIIYSDNATNFQGANNYLKEVHNFLSNDSNNKTIQSFLQSTETTWKFIPPKAPHWGGLWESAIKSAKYHLIRIVGNSTLTFEQLATVFSQIEAILNSRPLYQLSNDPSDLNPLTPGHFLIGVPLTSFPEQDISNTPSNRISFWQKCSQIQQQFWKRWKVDYLNRLQNRPKWMIPVKNFQVNDLVLIKDDDTPPLKWPLARIIKLFTGKDGNIRSVSLKTQDGIYTRPITKLSRLPITEQ